MKKVVIYTKEGHCPYCDRAKNILNRANLNYVEIIVKDAQDIVEMRKVVGQQVASFPQILINDVHIGGCDELTTMYRENKLC